MARRIKRKWVAPIFLFAVGLFLLAASVLYALVTGTAIPDQDPTLAMQEEFQFHSRVSFIGFVSGSIALGLSWVLALIVLMLGLVKKPSA